jgi:hypothetical protein
VRPPRAEDGWLVLGYLAWFGLICAIWQIVVRVR